jgi:hypothetical protein
MGYIGAEMGPHLDTTGRMSHQRIDGETGICIMTGAPNGSMTVYIQTITVTMTVTILSEYMV